MKTYKNFEEDFEKAKANIELLENIVSVGIPKKQAVYFNSISVDSKYSMGQRTYLYVGDKLVHYHIKTICITSKYLKLWH